MPKRPWITPDDLRTYSDDEGITNRPDEKLQIDISRAESYVLTCTHNRNLLDDEQYPEVPEAVRTATILIAEYYATTASSTKGYSSESFDDYSYSKDTSFNLFDELDINMLLYEFKKVGSVEVNALIV